MKKIILPVIASVLIAAHFSRIQSDWLALFALLFPLFLLMKKSWILRVYQTYLIIGGFIWIERTIFLASLRNLHGESWISLAMILGSVSLFTLLSALVFETKKIKAFYSKGDAQEGKSTIPSLIAFYLTGILLAFVHLKMDPPVLLLERFLPGTGFVEIALIAIYAAWVTEKMLDVKISSKIRSRVWILFSFVFFSQFILGLSGFKKFLMTGELHLPIPALIIGGPVFRGEGFFMLILFASTVILAGAAWCSHLCYAGSWDNLFSRQVHNPKALPGWSLPLRIGILLLLILSALVFRWAGLSSTAVTGIAILYGFIGFGVMTFISRKNGVMSHCVIYCPIGLAANILGRINPFRIRFEPACDDCGACSSACRYDALKESDIQKRKPGLTCTLCGDCLSRCGKDALRYSLFRLDPETARTVFIVLIVSLHAVFLGVARI
jgi:ferredoxin